MNYSHHQYEIISKKPTAFFWHPEGEIIKVTVIDCDFDKYVTMVDGKGNEYYYKWGYVFNTQEAAEESRDFDYVNWAKSLPDCIDVWKVLLSNKDYAMFKKTKRKNLLSETEWFVAEGDESYYTSTKFKTFKKALAYFGRLDEETTTFAALGENNNVGNLSEIEDGFVWSLPKNRYDKSSRVIKSSHIGKEKTYKQWRK